MVKLKNQVLFCLALFLFMPGQSYAGGIQATLARNKVSLNESFTLVFEAEGAVDGDPDFAPLEEHFEILRQSQGSSMQIINGQISQNKRWTLTLMAKEAGFFTIPPIFFGRDQSPSLRIDIEKPAKVQANGRAEPLFLEVSAEPESAYVQSQFIYTVRLYRAVELLSGHISDPDLSDGDAVIEKLGKDREFETRRNGIPYRVVERRYAIFPQQSGRLKLSPISFAGQLASRSRSLFSPFPGGGAIKRLRSESLELEVKPVPQDKIRGRWLPARGLRLTEHWPEASKGRALSKVGEPLTWTLSLTAEGLTAAQLPEIGARFPEDFKAYPDQAVLKNKIASGGIIGSREEKIALIPGKPGRYLLPAVEVPWWNTETEQLEFARIPEREIEVAPAQAALRPLPGPPLQSEAKKREGLDAGRAPEKMAHASGFWSWVSLVLALGWGLTLVVWWGARQPASHAKDTRVPLPDAGPILRQLKKACMKHEAAAAKEALLLWARIQWPETSLGLGEIGKRLGEPAASEIAALNARLYGQSSKPWLHGSELWGAFEAALSRLKSQKKRPRKERLSPMYP